MNFTTQIPISKSNFPMDYHSIVMLLGSCFAENMGEKFQYFKFQTEINPFGIIFNPVSLEKLIRRAVEQKYFTEEDIFYHNDLWHCFEVHSELSNPDKEAFLKLLNEKVLLTHRHIEKLTHCLITLGTSWVYRHIETNEVVANCHKVSQKHFVKELLSIEQIQVSLFKIMALVHSINPACHFVFTVSPVRHIKDGFVENNLSKAHLISGLHATIKQNEVASYFPSFEIMMDELRDYRFYAEDMLHPSPIAVAFIWEKFSQSFMDDTTLLLLEEVRSVNKSLLHRPFHPTSESHRKFVEKLESRIKNLSQQFPFMKWN